MTKLDQKNLRLAAADFLYLLDREYPRSASLQLVGNRYNLDRLHREVLHRGVFSRQAATQRRKRLVAPEQLAHYTLLVDGHNVIITTESSLVGRPLIAANDGLIRDVAGISHRYRISSQTHDVIENLCRFLHNYRPKETLFFLDAPIRQSGELAGRIRAGLKSWDLPGKAQALSVPEKRLVGAEGVVASSDSAVLDGVRQAFDLAAAVIQILPQKSEIIDFTFLG
jgi:hypothetical protein